jgi:hypothetical protein
MIKFREWLLPCAGLVGWLALSAYAVSLLLGGPGPVRPPVTARPLVLLAFRSS